MKEKFMGMKDWFKHEEKEETAKYTTEEDGGKKNLIFGVWIISI